MPTSNLESQNQIKKLIPIIGLALLIPISVAGFFYIRYTQSQASPEKEPKEIRITDMTDSSVVVSWITDTDTKGEVLYSTSSSLSKPSTSGDVRDESSVASRDTHYVRLTGLNSSTNYYFQIVSGGEKYGASGKGYFNFTTAQTPMSPSVPSPLKGLVTNGTKQSAMVYISLEEAGSTSFPVTTITNKSGAWAADLAAIRTGDLKALFSPTENTKVKIFVQGGKLGGASVVANIDSEIPDLTLKKDYDQIDIFVDSSIISNAQEQTGSSTAVTSTTSEVEEDETTEVLGASIKLEPMSAAEIAAVNYMDLLRSNGFSTLPATGDGAGGTSEPVEIHVTNITTTSFAITWITTDQSSGYVAYGETEAVLNGEAADDKDTSVDEADSYYTHHVTVDGLSAGKTYYYEIYSDGESYDDAGSAYSITLPSSLDSAGSAEVNAVVDYGDSSADLTDGFLLVQVEDSDNTGTSGQSTYLSVILDSEGAGSVDLSGALTSDYSDRFDFQDGDDVTFIAYGVNGESADEVATVADAGEEDVEITIDLGEIEDDESRIYMPVGAGDDLPSTGLNEEGNIPVAVIGGILYIGIVIGSVFVYKRVKKSLWEERVVRDWE